MRRRDEDQWLRGVGGMFAGMGAHGDGGRECGDWVLDSGEGVLDIAC